MVNLKGCPFCDSKARICFRLAADYMCDDSWHFMGNGNKPEEDLAYDYMISCTNIDCLCRTDAEPTLMQAMKVWNRREPFDKLNNFIKGLLSAKGVG